MEWGGQVKEEEDDTCGWPPPWGYRPQVSLKRRPIALQNVKFDQSVIESDTHISISICNNQRQWRSQKKNQSKGWHPSPWWRVFDVFWFVKAIVRFDNRSSAWLIRHIKRSDRGECHVNWDDWTVWPMMSSTARNWRLITLYPKCSSSFQVWICAGKLRWRISY